MKLLKRILFGKHSKISYSQSAEDIQIESIFGALGIQKPTYIDIGAHAPVYLSNTYLFYRKGSRGVCIEPNPHLYKNIQKNRKHDICLNMGVGIADPNLHEVVETTRILGSISQILHGYGKLIRLLRRARYDLVIDLRTGDRGAIFSFLTGAPVRIGMSAGVKKQFWHGILFTKILSNLTVAPPPAHPGADQSLRIVRGTLNLHNKRQSDIH